MIENLLDLCFQCFQLLNEPENLAELVRVFDPALIELIDESVPLFQVGVLAFGWAGASNDILLLHVNRPLPNHGGHL